MPLHAGRLTARRPPAAAPGLHGRPSAAARIVRLSAAHASGRRMLNISGRRDSAEGQTVTADTLLSMRRTTVVSDLPSTGAGSGLVPCRAEKLRRAAGLPGSRQALTRTGLDHALHAPSRLWSSLSPCGIGGRGTSFCHVPAEPGKSDHLALVGEDLDRSLRGIAADVEFVNAIRSAPLPGAAQSDRSPVDRDAAKRGMVCRSCEVDVIP